MKMNLFMILSFAFVSNFGFIEMSPLGLPRLLDLKVNSVESSEEIELPENEQTTFSPSETTTTTYVVEISTQPLPTTTNETNLIENSTSVEPVTNATAVESKTLANETGKRSKRSCGGYDYDAPSPRCSGCGCCQNSCNSCCTTIKIRRNCCSSSCACPSPCCAPPPAPCCAPQPAPCCAPPAPCCSPSPCCAPACGPCGCMKCGCAPRCCGCNRCGCSRRCCPPNVISPVHIHLHSQVNNYPCCPPTPAPCCGPVPKPCCSPCAPRPTYTGYPDYEYGSRPLPSGDYYDYNGYRRRRSLQDLQRRLTALVQPFLSKQ